MPAVALAPLALIAIAVLCLLLIYAFIYLVNAVAQLVPNWNVPGFSSIRKYVQDAAATALSIVTYALHLAITPLADVFNWTITAITTPIQKLEGALVSAGDALNWLRRNYIPVISATLSATIVGYYARAVAYTQELYNDAEADIQRAESYAVAHADQLYNQAAQLAGQVLTQAEQFATASVSALAGEATAAISAVESDARALAAQAETDALGLYHQALSFAQGLAAGVETDLDNAIGQLEAYANAAASAALAQGLKITDIDANIGIATAWPGIIDNVTAMPGVISTDFPDVSALWNAIPKVTPTTLTGALAGVVALAVPITQYLRDCGYGLCNNLHGFGNDLNALSEIVDAGAIWALLAEAAKSPTAAATDIRGLVDGTVASTVASFRSLIGLG